MQASVLQPVPRHTTLAFGLMDLVRSFSAATLDVASLRGVRCAACGHGILKAALALLEPAELQRSRDMAAPTMPTAPAGFALQAAFALAGQGQRVGCCARSKIAQCDSGSSQSRIAWFSAEFAQHTACPTP